MLRIITNEELTAKIVHWDLGSLGSEAARAVCVSASAVTKQSWDTLRHKIPSHLHSTFDQGHFSVFEFAWKTVRVRVGKKRELDFAHLGLWKANKLLTITESDGDLLVSGNAATWIFAGLNDALRGYGGYAWKTLNLLHEFDDLLYAIPEMDWPIRAELRPAISGIEIIDSLENPSEKLHHCGVEIAFHGFSRADTNQHVRHRSGHHSPFSHMQASTRGIDYTRDDVPYEFVAPQTWDGKFEVNLQYDDHSLGITSEAFIKLSEKIYQKLRKDVARNEHTKHYMLIGLHAPVVSVANPIGWLFWADRRADVHAEMGIRKSAFQVINAFRENPDFPVFCEFVLKNHGKLGPYMERPGKIYEKWLMRGVY